MNGKLTMISLELHKAYDGVHKSDSNVVAKKNNCYLDRSKDSIKMDCKSTNAPYLFIIILSISTVCHSQINLDSVLTVYESQKDDTTRLRTAKVLFDAYVNNDLDRAKWYALEELRIAEKISSAKGKGMAHLHIGVVNDYLSHLDSAVINYQAAKDIFESIDDHLNVSTAIRNLAMKEYTKGNYRKTLELLDEGIDLLNDKVKQEKYLLPFYHNKGLTHNFMGNYRLATIEVLKELKILEESDRRIQKADALNLLAIIEGNLKNFKKGIAYNEEALVIYNEYNDIFFAAQSLSDIGLFYLNLEQYDSSAYHLDKALSLAQQMNSSELQMIILNNKARGQLELGNYVSATEMLNESLAMAEQSGSTNKIAETLNELGKLYNRKSNGSRAISFLNRSIALGYQMEAKPTISMALENRAESYALIGDYRSAYKDYQAFKTLSDTINDVAKSQQIQELRTIYETEKKEQQITQQNTEIALLEQREKMANLQKLALGGGMVLSLLALAFGFYGFRQRMKSNQLAQDKIETELEFKKKELVTHALHLAKKNEVLENIKQKALEQKKISEEGRSYQKLVNIINLDINDDDSWESFSKQFREVHSDFYSIVSRTYPNITPGEMRLMSLIKMNLSSKEMANILNISISGIKKARQRLRKKMELETKDSLEHAVLNIS